MANRRMFSKTITENDAFLDMPLSAQALYFHLGMQADDEGFVTPKKIMRMIGANEDDLKILIAKRYILAFPDGVIVVKHWLINNYIQNDRSKPTTYQKEKLLLQKNEYGAYTEIQRKKPQIRQQNIASHKGGQKKPLIFVNSENENNSSENDPMYTKGIQTGDIGKVSIGKVSIGKVNSNTNVITKSPIETASAVLDDKKSGLSKKIDGMFDYWENIVGYRVTAKIKTNREYCSKLLKQYDNTEIALMIRATSLASEDRFAPRIANFSDLYRRWDELKLWGKKKGIEQNARAEF